MPSSWFSDKGSTSFTSCGESEASLDSLLGSVTVPSSLAPVHSGSFTPTFSWIRATFRIVLGLRRCLRFIVGRARDKCLISLDSFAQQSSNLFSDCFFAKLGGIPMPGRGIGICILLDNDFIFDPIAFFSGLLIAVPVDFFIVEASLSPSEQGSTVRELTVAGFGRIFFMEGSITSFASWVEGFPVLPIPNSLILSLMLLAAAVVVPETIVDWLLDFELTFAGLLEVKSTPSSSRSLSLFVFSPFFAASVFKPSFGSTPV
mmetsp:Transcript_10277/g.13493  ORF Transcript_10277/g.13493 Transcript_10277/m.13493 type:complete len:260 (-) Transcript_10277:740-1519(-)